MFPRLNTSKKWTSIPQEYIDQIKQVFSENFAEHLLGAKLIVQGRIYQQEILLRVGYLEKDRLAQSNFEVSIDYKSSSSDQIMEKIHTAIDAVGSIMNEYFEMEQNLDLPRVWKEFEFNKTKLYIQFSTENTDLEQQANELLGVTEDQILNDNDESDEELSADLEDLEDKKKLH